MELITNTLWPYIDFKQICRAEKSIIETYIENADFELS